MTTLKDIYIMDAVRTPIGRLGGALAEVRPDDMAALVVKALVERTGVDVERIEDVMFGCANQAGEDNRNVGRMALLLGLAMLPAGAIAMQVGLNAVAARQAAHEETLSRRALQSISVESGVIEEVREMMRVMATTPALQQIETGDCRQWLGEVALRYPYVATIGVTDENGRLLCSYPEAPPVPFQTISLPSFCLAESAVLRASLRTFLVRSWAWLRTTGPKMVAPPRNCGERSEPWRALPVPFCE